ncbi:unnamed protein product [Durusdinium trenchii]|uniref:Ankyrin repeat and SOCS box protein 2 n=2 Tax=Durusdinium trenchii TaxID=1381693 RepID=A0ABP0I823_9DINO
MLAVALKGLVGEDLGRWGVEFVGPAPWRSAKMTFFYKQLTPARLWAMLVEDVSQGLLAFAVSTQDGFTAYMFMMNIAVPALRICWAWAFHYKIAGEVREWMLQEAVDAVAEGRAASQGAGEAAPCQFKRRFQRRRKGWTGLDSSSFKYPFLNWMSLQNLAEGDDVDGLSSDQVTVCKGLLWLVLEDANAMKGLVTLWELWKHQTLRIGGYGHGTGDRRIGDPECRALALGIGQMQHLTNLALHIANNKIGKDGCESLGEGISKLQQLTHLSLGLMDRLTCPTNRLNGMLFVRQAWS